MVSKCDLNVCVSYQLLAHQLKIYCYLLCGNGLDPHITSHFWRARCWALSREDTGRTRRRKGLFLGLVLPFYFPQIHIPLSQAEAVRLQQVPCAGGS